MEVKVISMKSSVERRMFITSQLKDIDFNFYDAEIIDHDVEHFINQHYSRDKAIKYKGFELTKAELGCFASHITLWQQCVTQNIPYLILEDNFTQNATLSSYLKTISSLVKSYGFIKLDNRANNRRYQIIKKIDEQHDLVVYKKGVSGTSGYALTPQTAKKLLDMVHGFFEPVDDFIDNEWRTKQTVYCFYPPLLERANLTSTIGKRKNKSDITIKNRISKEFYRIYKQTKQKIYNLSK